jgi:ABC-type nickel/cobalt efflux system permease component RcnA
MVNAIMLIIVVCVLLLLLAALRNLTKAAQRPSCLITLLILAIGVWAVFTYVVPLVKDGSREATNGLQRIHTRPMGDWVNRKVKGVLDAIQAN